MPSYFLNFNQNTRSLLPKFFGLYTYVNRFNQVRLIVMNNILPSSFKPIHMRFDLKGSTYGRNASEAEKRKSQPTLKDNDFLDMFSQGALRVKQQTYDSLVKTIGKDCLVLMSFGIMDYSMLIGIHRLDQNVKRNKEGQCTIAHPLYLTTMGSIAAPGQPIRIDSTSPAPTDMFGGGILATTFRGERVVVFLGIIDILQSYGVRKRLEHVLKTAVLNTDPESISVTDPKIYARRFLNFFTTRVFQPLPTSPMSHCLAPTQPFVSVTGNTRYKMKDQSSQSTLNTIRSMPSGFLGQQQQQTTMSKRTRRINVYSTKL
ncbi:hypothetical protein ACOME3_004749 [Neoechinorhynchus agilis]